MFCNDDHFSMCCSIVNVLLLLHNIHIANVNNVIFSINIMQLCTLFVLFYMRMVATKSTVTKRYVLSDTPYDFILSVRHLFVFSPYELF